jgi:hypothetical protein
MATSSKGAAADRLAPGCAALGEVRWDRWLACALPVGDGIAVAARR